MKVINGRNLASDNRFDVLWIGNRRSSRNGGYYSWIIRVRPEIDGGIGIKRSLFALLKGEKIEKADDVTFFGKNPDSHPVYVY